MIPCLIYSYESILVTHYMPGGSNIELGPYSLSYLNLYLNLNQEILSFTQKNINKLSTVHPLNRGVACCVPEKWSKSGNLGENLVEFLV